MKNRSAILVVLVVLIVVAAGALGFARRHKQTTPASNMSSMNMQHAASTSKSSSTAAQAVATTAVTIQDFSFSPAAIKVKVGQSVTWTNKDSASHTVTADTPSADAPDSQLLANGQSYSFTFNKAGTYTYHCKVHPSMKGTVVVE